MHPLSPSPPPQMKFNLEIIACATLTQSFGQGPKGLGQRFRAMRALHFVFYQSFKASIVCFWIDTAENKHKLIIKT